jgi:hypothetical protein
VQQFFMNGGSDAYVVRVAAGAAAATVQLKYGTAGGNVALVAQARSEGAWGNLLRLDVDYATSDPANLFNLAVTRWDPVTQAVAEREDYLNLTLNSRSPAYAPSVVNAASRLITLTRGAGMAFGAGFSQSGDISAVAMAATNLRLKGRVDDEVDFELVLAPPPVSDSVTKIFNRIAAAITNSPEANGRVVASRADADGTPNGSGNFIRLTSAASGDFSSVVIVPAAQDDASAVLGFGRAANGQEANGAAPFRPAPTGTSSDDIAGGVAIGGPVNVQIDNQGTAGPPLESASVNVTAAMFGPTLRDNLQAAIRTMTHPAAKGAVVRIQGSTLQIIAPDAWPNVTFTLTGLAALQMPAAGVTLNVSRYVPGVGPAFGAQAGAVKGADGTPPGATEFKGSFNAKTGIYALRDVDLFNLLCIPTTARLAGGIGAVNSLIQEATAYCEAERAFYIIDPPAAIVDAATMEAWLPTVTSRNAAVYFPRLLAADPLDAFRLREMPASGAVAGVYARTDAQRGVWKAPAGTEAVLNGTQGLSLVLTDPENGPLNQKGVNVLRSFPVYGRVVWGARTRAGADENTDEYKYVPVRRLALFLEETLFRNTQWVVFEPNDEPLWAQIRMNLGAFMNNLFRQGAFQGKTPREAYLVKCDAETTTQYDIDRGIVNILVAFAPLKPAEFVVIRIQQKAQIPA